MINIDKLYHFIIGLLISSSIGILYPTIGLLVSILLAILKEYYDYKHSDKHTSDANDAIATINGAVLGYILIKGIL